jgi:hypothetical protein
MIWKPKEKELTPEEAVTLAKKELTPFWFGSPPLLAGIQQEGQSLIVPLSKDFTKEAWIIFLIDPTAFEGENAMVHAKEWHRRYHLNNLGFIIVLVPSYEYLRRPDSIQKLIERQDISFPLVLDAESGLAHALNATQLPKIVLLNKGRVVDSRDEKEAFSVIELRLQKFLRSMDLGLPLLPLFFPVTTGVVDVDRYEFGYKPKVGVSLMVFPAPGFVAGDDGILRAKFVDRRSKNTDEKDESAEKFIIIGEWQQYPEGIATSDPNAYIEFISPAKRVSLVAAPAGKVGQDPPRINVDVGGMAVYEAISGEDLRVEDSGETQVRVVKALLYHILMGLPPRQRVGLRFPNAQRSPIALLGMRFGE